MVHFSIFRGRRKKRKDGRPVGNKVATYSLSEHVSSPSSSFSSDDSSYLSSYGESYESGDSYSLDSSSTGPAGTSACAGGNGAACNGTNVPDLVKAFTQYASLEIQQTRQDLAENISKTEEEFEKAKEMTRERFVEFQEGLEGKFQSIKTSLALGTVNNESTMARMEKQLQLWKDRAKNLEKQMAGDHILSSNGSTEKKNVVAKTSQKSKMSIIERREPVVDKKKKAVDRQPIDRRDPVAANDRNSTEQRQLPDPSEDEAIPTTIRSGNNKILSTQEALPFQNRDRAKSDGHSLVTKKTTIMSPKLPSEHTSVQTSITPKKGVTMPPRLASPRAGKNLLMSPKKKITTPSKMGKTVKNDKLDEIVARVIRSRSSKSKFEHSENTFELDWVTFGSKQETAKISNEKVENPFREIPNETDEMAAKKLQDAQKEIETLKKLLADKESDRKNTLKPKDSALWVFHDAPFDEAVPDENAISSRTKPKIKTSDNGLESKACPKKSPLTNLSSHKEFHDPVLEEINIAPNPVHELNWNNFVGMDGRVDAVCDASPLLNRRKPRQYAKGIRYEGI